MLSRESSLPAQLLTDNNHAEVHPSIRYVLLSELAMKILLTFNALDNLQGRLTDNCPPII